MAAWNVADSRVLCGMVRFRDHEYVQVISYVQFHVNDRHFQDLHLEYGIIDNDKMNKMGGHPGKPWTNGKGNEAC